MISQYIDPPRHTLKNKNLSFSSHSKPETHFFKNKDFLKPLSL